MVIRSKPKKNWKVFNWKEAKILIIWFCKVRQDQTLNVCNWEREKMNPLNQYSKTLLLQISLYGIHAYSGVSFITFICNLELQ